MSTLKTKQNEKSVTEFLNSIEDERKRKDSFAIMDLIEKATMLEPKMWGSSIIGFGSYHYKYKSGHEGDTCIVGFSPRKQNITLYLQGINDYGRLLEALGKHKTGKGCLYFNKLEDINTSVLKQLISKSVESLKKSYNLNNK